MNSIETAATWRKTLTDDLDKFIKMYNGTQLNLISALADKIKHMCINIGSPSSVMPMLKSIVKGKLKSWYLGDYNTLPVKLNPRMHIAEKDRKYSDWEYVQIEGTTGECESHWRKIVTSKNYIKGHFRWNFGNAYVANYETRNYIQAYFIDKNVEAYLKKTNNSNDFRFSIAKAFAQKHSDTLYTVEVTTPRNNEYRFHYYVTDDLVTSNYGLGDVTETESAWAKKVFLSLK